MASNNASYQNAFYCLRAEKGFTAANGDLTKRNYTVKLDMKTQKNAIYAEDGTVSEIGALARLKEVGSFNKPDGTTNPNADKEYNKIMWILDNMYLPKQSTEEEKIALLTKAGIFSSEEDEYIGHERITNEDIEVVQQLALWYFTNADSNHYNGETLPTLYWSEDDNKYYNFEDLYNVGIDAATQYGKIRQDECAMLYKYFLDNAKTKGDYVSEDAISPVTLDKSRVVVTPVASDDSYIMGPFKINVNSTMNYTKNKLGFTDENGNTFSYILLDENKRPVTNTIDSLNGHDFYIKVSEDLKISKIRFDINIDYSRTTATYYTTEGNSYKDQQPVVLVEKEKPNYSDYIEIPMPTPKAFDLSLRKFITKINGVDVKISRVPIVNTTALANGTSTTAVYEHTKAPLTVKVGDIVTYKIRVYNEGAKDGYVSEITDHLPAQLEFLPDDQDNIANGWFYDEEDITLRTIKTTHLSKDTDTDNLIEAFNGTTLKYKDVEVKCKVVADPSFDRRIVNIAEITQFTDKNGNAIVDRDSQAKNVVLPTDEILPNYKQVEIDRGDKYIPGQQIGNDFQDDDDFDNVVIKSFDLSLRKFITKVDNLDINNRYPSLSMREDGTISYTHTKEPVAVANSNIVTYTIRVYNEGTVAGYAKEITDDLPQGLLFLPENETNIGYRWIMLDKDGNKTDDVEKAEKITTDYLSKAEEKTEGGNLLKAFDRKLGLTETNPDYRDVKVAFKVTEPNTSDRIIINTAEISEDSDENDKPIDDIDSIPGNNKEGEDDIDIDKVRVKYFDLALKKWVTQAIVTQNGKTTVTETGHTGEENPEPVVKVDLKKSDLKKVTVKFKYKIKVINEGELEGYVKEIKDYIPDGLKFVASDNPLWKQISEKEVTTDQRKDLLLKPGESTTVEIILTWENSDKNLGLKVNWAEISKDYNEYGDTPDIDSTPNNNKPGEDDIDNAPVILAVKTGEARVYITLTTIILVTIAGGIVLIKKFVL